MSVRINYKCVSIFSFKILHVKLKNIFKKYFGTSYYQVTKGQRLVQITGWNNNRVKFKFTDFFTFL